jgi:tetratricopeptide (TPR) repeat protein
MAVASSSEGLLASIDRKYDRAEAHFQMALDLGEHAPFVAPLVFANRARSRTARAFSGVAEDRMATLDAAAGDFEVAIEFFEAADVAAGLVTTLPFAAWHSILTGNDGKAELYLDRTLQIAEELGYGWPAAVARSIEGLLRLTRKQPERAEEDLDEAEEGLEKWGDRYSMQITESFRAAALLQQGRREAAVNAVVHALTLMESQGSREWEAMTTGIALAVMADAHVSGEMTGRCLGWLEAKHPTWRDIVSTVGVAIPELEPPSEMSGEPPPASEIARACRTELQALASSGVD